MILFLDTSALVKLYILEDGSNKTHEAALQAELLAVSRIAWAEYHAALARRSRMVPEDEPMLDQARNALADDWEDFFIMEVGQSVVDLAADYAELYALRAYDAVQLATASHLAGQSGQDVQFGCFDRRLNKAAAAQGMKTL